MRKIFIAFQFALLLVLSSALFTGGYSFPGGMLSLATVSAADNSQFQNTSPWFVGWFNKVKTEATSIFSWFQNKAQNAVGGKATPQAQQPINQYPALANPNSQQQQQQQQSGGSGGDQNGTPKTPYKLEPNQFKKMCGQNTYVLYWRKGGKEGRDMAQPAGGAGAGKNQGAKDYWQLPTCEELAECHCCCNTCVTPESECKAPGWVFNNKGCPPNCKPKCEGDCKPKCEQWQQPQGPGDPTLNRDCKCNMEGCPKSNAKDCSIIIMDPGRTQVEFTKKDGNPEQYFKGTGIAYFKNGNGPSDEKSKVIAGPEDKKEGTGWVAKLKNEKGKCCKCYQDGPPIQ